MPTNEIYDIESDNLGRMWFTSDRGVSVYDGYTFTNYGIEDGLTDNTNFEIVKDNKGWLWFTAYNGTLSYYDGETIKPAGINEELKKINYTNWIEQIIQLSDDKYLLIPYTLVGTTIFRDDCNVNIYEYDISQNTISYIDLSSFKPLEQDTTVLHSEKYGIGLDQNYFTFFPYELNDTISYVGRDMAQKTGLFSVTKVLGANSTLYNQLNETYTVEVNCDNNNLYLCTNNGLKIIELEKDNKSKSILSGNFITKFLKGPQNNYWVSTQDNGVYFIPSLAIKNHKLTQENFDPVNLRVWNNHLVITAKNEEGLIVLNEELEPAFEKYNVARLFYSWSKSIDDDLYFCNLGKLSYQKDRDLFEYTPSAITNTNGTYAVFRESVYIGNNKWYCPTLSSLVSVDLNKPKTRSIQNIDYSIESMYKTKNNVIYLGTSKGLKKFTDPHFIEDLEKSNTIYQRKINNIISLENNYSSGLLMSTLGFGLIYKSDNETSPQEINTEQGLSSNTINIIKVENDSILWIGSTKGLDRINYTINEDSLILNSISTINKSNGLASNYILDIAFWNEEIWVTTKSGIFYFKYDELDLLPKQASIYYDKLKVNNIDVNLRQNLNFKYDKNNIDIHYTGISYSKPIDRSFYKTIFTKDGKDSLINYTDNREAQFIDLTAGDYLFSVQACDSNGDFTSTPIKLQFCIQRHYSQTIGFKLIVLLLFLLLAYFLYKAREKTLLKRAQQEVELQNAKLQTKAAELNALRNQMNPHFIYNTLNSIQNYIFKGDPEMANYLLSRFGKLMRSSLKLSGLEYITIETELNFLENYLELEQMRFENKFTYNINIAHDGILNLKIPPLLLQPLLENSIKHGIENQLDGQLLIQIDEDNNYITLIIEDNGSGYDPTNIPKREGPSALKIIRERINIINKNAKALSSFTIEGMNANSATGTRATIKLSKSNNEDTNN